MASTAGENARLQRLATGAQRAAIANKLTTSPLASRNRGLIVNAGISKEAYFQSRSNNEPLWDTLKFNTPANSPSKVSDAKYLWADSTTSKGMFATSTYLTSTNVNEKGKNVLTAAQQLAQYERYGFVFHYNPTTIEMAYSGIADMDYTMLTSGREAFNLLGTQATQSTISFNIVLNRIHDMKYFNPETQRLRPSIRENEWSGRFPIGAEQQDLFNKGTMYDVEFFLRTVMQVPISTYLSARNVSWDKKTADIGFLTGIPVELHLGKSMRYLVRIDGFRLNHVIFNERMVPMFTEMSIQASRIPDYAADTAYRPEPVASSKNTNKPGSSWIDQYNNTPDTYFDYGNSQEVTINY